MNKEEVIKYMEIKVEEIVKQKLQENFNDTKQVNAKVVTREIINELQSVMNYENN